MARPNRFVLLCRIEGRPRTASPERVHLPDPGRLRELLVPDAPLLVRAAGGPGRSTDWSAVLVRTPDDDGWVSVDTTLPNRLVREALDEGTLEELDGWVLDRAEWPHGRSRFDFLLRRAPGSPDEGAHVRGSGAGPPHHLALEVKSVTLVDGGVARFPDAVTTRGARHLDELAALARRPGWAAAALFVVQRPGAREIRPAAAIDPHFADRLAAAAEAGVRLLGRRCTITEAEVALGAIVPVRTTA